MPREEIRQLVINGVRGLMNGRSSDKALNDDVSPILDLGLESIDGVDFACELGTPLGVRIPDSVNPFVLDQPRRARTISEIVELLASLQASASQKG